MSMFNNPSHQAAMMALEDENPRVIKNGFISSILFDALMITTLCGGLKKMTGLSVFKLLEPSFKRESTKSVARMYFDAGDWVVEKSVGWWNRRNAAAGIKPPTNGGGPQPPRNPL